MSLLQCVHAKSQGLCFYKTVNSYHYAMLILTLCCTKLWPPTFPDLNVYDCHLWGHWNTETMWMICIHHTTWKTSTEQKLKCHNNWMTLTEEKLNISRQEFGIVLWNISSRWIVGLEAGGWHFDTLLWSKIIFAAGQIWTKNSWKRQASYTIKLLCLSKANM